MKTCCFLLCVMHLYCIIDLQANIFALAWSRHGQMLGIGEKVVLPLLTVYMLLLISLGIVAVSAYTHVCMKSASRL